MAVGPLGWPPAVFWSATVTEFFAACDMFNEMHGGEQKPDAPTDDEMAKLLERYG